MKSALVLRCRGQLTSCARGGPWLAAMPPFTLTGMIVSRGGDCWVLVDSGIKSFAADPLNDEVIYGISTQNHVIKTVTAGKQWLTLNTGMGDLTPSLIYVNPDNEQEVFVGTTEGLIKTTDAGFTWGRTSFAQPVDEFRLDRKSPSHQYVLSSGTAFVFADGGKSWARTEAGLPSDLVRGAGRTASRRTVKLSLLVAVDWGNGFLLAATSGKGLYQSDDDGASWRPAGLGSEVDDTFVMGSVASHRITVVSGTSSSLTETTNVSVTVN